MSLVTRREIDVEERIAEFLKKFVGKKFNGVTISEVVRQYDRGLEGRRVDIAVLKDDGVPLLLVETKKKYEVRGYKVERRFIVTSEEVLGQIFSYVAILKKNGVYVPFVATANDRQIAVFMVPEDIDRHVNWEAVKTREYARVLPNDYVYGVLRPQYLLFHRQIRFTEDFFAEILEALTGIYVKKYGIEEKKQELHWVLIEDLRGIVDFLTPFIQDAIAPGGKYREEIDKFVEDYAKTRGYRPTPEQLAREMAYVLLNKIVFYKVLEKHYKLEPLKSLYKEGAVKSVSEYLKKLNELFSKAVEVTGDFELVFETGIYDHIDVVESEEVLKVLDWIIELIDAYRIEKFGDIIGYVYEDLIPAEERHRLGQFYTPKPIAELIVKWCIRSPDDRVLDPGCGSGTFLVEAYKRLTEFKLKKPYAQIKHVPEDIHRQILRQLYGVDINEFPVHLTAMNLAMKNIRAPSTEMYIFVRDYFSIVPGQRVIVPFKIKVPKGEMQVEVVLKDFDAIVGNPPYTRWGEIPSNTQNLIITRIGDILERYDLLPQAGRRGAEYNMVVFWIMHSIGFLKEGGRLGMIVSDSWLQTAYGVRFGKLLADHFKIHAIVDISTRVFPVPLIGSCIVLLEKCSNENERNDNTTAFIYLNIKKGGIDITEILKLVELKQPINVSTDNYDVNVKVYKQSELRSDEPWIQFLFNANDVMSRLSALEGKVLTKLSNYFEPTYGNILYTVLYTRRIVKTRHAGIGGESFFYLTEERARHFGIPQEFLMPIIPSSRYMEFFTFSREDWDRIREGGAECYLFLCHRPRNELPPQILRYIQLGETEIRLTKGVHRGEPVSRARAAEERRRLRGFFFDWYDLGGVVEAPIYATYGSQYWVRFVLAKYQCALDHRILALIPKKDVTLNEMELKALLAFLNSSFSQLQAEAKGRSTGGGMLELDIAPLSEFLIIDVKKLSREVVERLAQLFDKLEAEARRLGGADSVKNVFGTELAKELVGREVEQEVAGLFNTVIKEIDYEVARLLSLENMVEAVRALVITMAKRRLSRASEAKPSVLRSSEPTVAQRPSRSRRSREADSKPPSARLDKWFKSE